METLVFLRYPSQDIRQIEVIVRDRESFVALIEGDLYSIGQHIAERDSFKFSAMLDRNVYTRIAALVSGAELRTSEMDDLRWAAAILAFCQIAGITFDYASSLYELAHSKGGAAALENLGLFRIADNSDPGVFVDFAVGRTAKIEKESLAVLSAKANPPAKEFERVIPDFRINYTFALKIAELSLLQIPSAEKMIRL